MSPPLLPRIACALALITPLAGCVDGGMTPTLLAWDTVSLINTDKTMGDHAMSLYRGKDCSTVRAYYGGPYCIEKTRYNPPPPQEMYCYKSLGDVTCFERPDPYVSSRQLVGTPIHTPASGQR